MIDLKLQILERAMQTMQQRLGVMREKQDRLSSAISAAGKKSSSLQLTLQQTNDAYMRALRNDVQLLATIVRPDEQLWSDLVHIYGEHRGDLQSWAANVPDRQLDNAAEKLRSGVSRTVIADKTRIILQDRVRETEIQSTQALRNHVLTLAAIVQPTEDLKKKFAISHKDTVASWAAKLPDAKLADAEQELLSVSLNNTSYTNDTQVLKNNVQTLAALVHPDEQLWDDLNEIYGSTMNADTNLESWAKSVQDSLDEAFQSLLKCLSRTMSARETQYKMLMRHHVKMLAAFVHPYNGMWEKLNSIHNAQVNNLRNWANTVPDDKLKDAAEALSPMLTAAPTAAPTAAAPTAAPTVAATAEAPTTAAPTAAPTVAATAEAAAKAVEEEGRAEAAAKKAEYINLMTTMVTNSNIELELPKTVTQDEAITRLQKALKLNGPTIDDVIDTFKKKVDNNYRNLFDLKGTSGPDRIVLFLDIWLRDVKDFGLLAVLENAKAPAAIQKEVKWYGMQLAYDGKLTEDAKNVAALRLQDVADRHNLQPTESADAIMKWVNTLAVSDELLVLKETMEELKKLLTPSTEEASANGTEYRGATDSYRNMLIDYIYDSRRKQCSYITDNSPELVTEKVKQIIHDYLPKSKDGKITQEQKDRALQEVKAMHCQTVLRACSKEETMETAGSCLLRLFLNSLHVGVEVTFDGIHQRILHVSYLMDAIARLRQRFNGDPIVTTPSAPMIPVEDEEAQANLQALEASMIPVEDEEAQANLQAYKELEAYKQQLNPPNVNDLVVVGATIDSILNDWQGNESYEKLTKSEQHGLDYFLRQAHGEKDLYPQTLTPKMYEVLRSGAKSTVTQNMRAAIEEYLGPSYNIDPRYTGHFNTGTVFQERNSNNIIIAIASPPDPGNFEDEKNTASIAATDSAASHPGYEGEVAAMLTSVLARHDPQRVTVIAAGPLAPSVVSAVQKAPKGVASILYNPIGHVPDEARFFTVTATNSSTATTTTVRRTYGIEIDGPDEEAGLPVAGAHMKAFQMSDSRMPSSLKAMAKVLAMKQQQLDTQKARRNIDEFSRRIGLGFNRGFFWRQKEEEERIIDAFEHYVVEYAERNKNTRERNDIVADHIRTLESIDLKDEKKAAIITNRIQHLKDYARELLKNPTNDLTKKDQNYKVGQTFWALTANSQAVHCVKQENGNFIAVDVNNNTVSADFLVRPFYNPPIVKDVLKQDAEVKLVSEKTGRVVSFSDGTYTVNVEGENKIFEPKQVWAKDLQLRSQDKYADGNGTLLSHLNRLQTGSDIRAFVKEHSLASHEDNDTVVEGLKRASIAAMKQARAAAINAAASAKTLTSGLASSSTDPLPAAGSASSAAGGARDGFNIGDILIVDSGPQGPPALATVEAIEEDGKVTKIVPSGGALGGTFQLHKVHPSGYPSDHPSDLYQLATKRLLGHAETLIRSKSKYQTLKRQRSIYRENSAKLQLEQNVFEQVDKGLQMLSDDFLTPLKAGETLDHARAQTKACIDKSNETLTKIDQLATQLQTYAEKVEAEANIPLPTEMMNQYCTKLAEIEKPRTDVNAEENAAAAATGAEAAGAPISLFHVSDNNYAVNSYDVVHAELNRLAQSPELAQSPDAISQSVVLQQDLKKRIIDIIVLLKSERSEMTKRAEQLNSKDLETLARLAHHPTSDVYIAASVTSPALTSLKEVKSPEKAMADILIRSISSRTTESADILDHWRYITKQQTDVSVTFRLGVLRAIDIREELLRQDSSIEERKKAELEWLNKEIETAPSKALQWLSEVNYQSEDDVLRHAITVTDELYRRAPNHFKDFDEIKDANLICDLLRPTAEQTPPSWLETPSWMETPEWLLEAGVRVRETEQQVARKIRFAGMSSHGIANSANSTTPTAAMDSPTATAIAASATRTDENSKVLSSLTEKMVAASDNIDDFVKIMLRNEDLAPLLEHIQPIILQRLSSGTSQATNSPSISAIDTPMVRLDQGGTVGFAQETIPILGIAPKTSYRNKTVGEAHALAQQLSPDLVVKDIIVNFFLALGGYDPPLAAMPESLQEEIKKGRPGMDSIVSDEAAEKVNIYLTRSQLYQNFLKKIVTPLQQQEGGGGNGGSAIKKLVFTPITNSTTTNPDTTPTPITKSTTTKPDSTRTARSLVGLPNSSSTDAALESLVGTAVGTEKAGLADEISRLKVHLGRLSVTPNLMLAQGVTREVEIVGQGWDRGLGAFGGIGYWRYSGCISQPGAGLIFAPKAMALADQILGAWKPVRQELKLDGWGRGFWWKLWEPSEYPSFLPKLEFVVKDAGEGSLLHAKLQEAAQNLRYGNLLRMSLEDGKTSGYVWRKKNTIDGLKTEIELPNLKDYLASIADRGSELKLHEPAFKREISSDSYIKDGDVYYVPKSDKTILEEMPMTDATAVKLKLDDRWYYCVRHSLLVDRYEFSDQVMTGVLTNVFADLTVNTVMDGLVTTSQERTLIDTYGELRKVQERLEKLLDKDTSSTLVEEANDLVKERNTKLNAFKTAIKVQHRAMPTEVTAQLMTYAEAPISELMTPGRAMMASGHFFQLFSKAAMASHFGSIHLRFLFASTIVSIAADLGATKTAEFLLSRMHFTLGGFGRNFRIVTPVGDAPNRAEQQREEAESRHWVAAQVGLTVGSAVGGAVGLAFGAPLWATIVGSLVVGEVLMELSNWNVHAPPQ